MELDTIIIKVREQKDGGSFSVPKENILKHLTKLQNRKKKNKKV